MLFIAKNSWVQKAHTDKTRKEEASKREDDYFLIRREIHTHSDTAPTSQPLHVNPM